MNPFTKIMNGNKSYTATFAINTYTLSTSVVGSGSVNRNPSQANYNHGTSVQVTAVPGTGYSFTGWSGDTTGTNNPFTVILHENKSYTATFTINAYTLSTSVIGNGAVLKNPDQPTYNHGTSVQLTASAGLGYSFSAWSGDTTGTMNPFTKIMNGNKSYTATFTINAYTLRSTSVVGNGAVLKNPDQPTYNHGTSVQVTASAGLRLLVLGVERGHHRHHEPVHQDHEREQELHRDLHPQCLHALDFSDRQRLGDPQSEPGHLQPRHLGPGHRSSRAPATTSPAGAATPPAP